MSGSAPHAIWGAQFHKLISEVGELSDAILGRHEGFPSPAEGWGQNLRDEAADVVLTVMAIAVTEKFSLADAVASKWSRRKRGPAGAAHTEEVDL